MAIQFHTLRVRELVRETKDAVTIVFDVPENLSATFKYLAGQYLTIKIPTSDTDNDRRAYSISSSPFLDEPLAVTVKRVDMGKVSAYLNDNVKVGDYLEVMPPLGNFTPNVQPDNTNGYIFYSAGSGITPIFSMIKSILIAEKNSKLTLFYTSRYIDSIIYKNSLDKLASEYSNRLSIIYSLTHYDESWQGHRGRFNAINLSTLLGKFDSNYVCSAEHFICGPNGLMQQVEEALLLLDVSPDKIHKESFASGANSAAADSNLLNGIVQRNIKVKLYGETFNVDVPPEDNVLSAVQKAGYMPPYSCLAGTCSTCCAKTISGKFVMDICESLSEKEKRDGYILTCRAHPIEDNSFVDFDF